MTIDIKKWSERRVRPHFDKNCDGITTDDCVETITEDIRVLVNQVRVDTIKEIIAGIRSNAPELEHGDPVHGLADDLEKLAEFKEWEKDAKEFLRQISGEPPT